MKRLTFAIILSVTMMVGAASAQSATQVKQYYDYYTQLVDRWTAYRDNTVLPYYNDPKYRAWATNEYRRANGQIAEAKRLQIMYAKQYESISKYQTTGTEIVTKECWVRRVGEQCNFMYGYTYYYDNGTSNTADYYKKRELMARNGLMFQYAIEHSRRRINEIKYR